MNWREMGTLLRMFLVLSENERVCMSGFKCQVTIKIKEALQQRHTMPRFASSIL